MSNCGALLTTVNRLRAAGRLTSVGRDEQSQEEDVHGHEQQQHDLEGEEGMLEALKGIGLLGGRGDIKGSGTVGGAPGAHLRSHVP